MNIRPATPADAEYIAEIQTTVPTLEHVKLLESPTLAQLYERRLAALTPPGREALIAIPNGNTMPVGVLEFSIGHESRDRRAHLMMLRRMFGTVEVIRLLPKMYARTKVEIPVPEDSLHVCDLDVLPEWRHRGVASDLLRAVEQEAKDRGIEIVSLCTWDPHPSLALYWRNDYVITDGAYDKRYEREFGFAGRVMMMKDVS